MVFESAEQRPMVRNSDLIQISDKIRYSSDYCLQFTQESQDVEEVEREMEIISASEVEEIILIHPAVDRAVVVRNSEGQFRAFVVLKRGYENEKSEDIQSFVNDQVKPQNQLHGGLYIMPNLKNSLSKKDTFLKTDSFNPDQLQLPPPAAAA